MPADSADDTRSQEIASAIDGIPDRIGQVSGRSGVATGGRSGVATGGRSGVATGGRSGVASSSSSLSPEHLASLDSVSDRASRPVRDLVAEAGFDQSQFDAMVERYGFGPQELLLLMLTRVTGLDASHMEVLRTFLDNAQTTSADFRETLRSGQETATMIGQLRESLSASSGAGPLTIVLDSILSAVQGDIRHLSVAEMQEYVSRLHEAFAGRVVGEWVNVFGQVNDVRSRLRMPTLQSVVSAATTPQFADDETRRGVQSDPARDEDVLAAIARRQPPPIDAGGDCDMPGPCTAPTDIVQRCRLLRALGGGKSGAYVYLVELSGERPLTGAPKRRILKVYGTAYDKEGGIKDSRPFRETDTLCRMSGVPGFPEMIERGCAETATFAPWNLRAPAPMVHYVAMSTATGVELSKLDLQRLTLSQKQSLAIQLLELLCEASRRLGDTFQHFDLHPDNIFVDVDERGGGAAEATPVKCFGTEEEPHTRDASIRVSLIDFDLVNSRYTAEAFGEQFLPEQTTKVMKPPFLPERTLAFIHRWLPGIQSFMVMESVSRVANTDVRNWLAIMSVLLHQVREDVILHNPQSQGVANLRVRLCLNPMNCLERNAALLFTGIDFSQRADAPMSEERIHELQTLPVMEESTLSTLIQKLLNVVQDNTRINDALAHFATAVQYERSEKRPGGPVPIRIIGEPSYRHPYRVAAVQEVGGSGETWRMAVNDSFDGETAQPITGISRSISYDTLHVIFRWASQQRTKISITLYNGISFSVSLSKLVVMIRFKQLVPIIEINTDLHVIADFKSDKLIAFLQTASKLLSQLFFAGVKAATDKVTGKPTEKINQVPGHEWWVWVLPIFLEIANVNIDVEMMHPDTIPTVIFERAVVNFSDPRGTALEVNATTPRGSAFHYFAQGMKQSTEQNVGMLSALTPEFAKLTFWKIVDAVYPSLPKSRPGFEGLPADYDKSKTRLWADITYSTNFPPSESKFACFNLPDISGANRIAALSTWASQCVDALMGFLPNMVHGFVASTIWGYTQNTLSITSGPYFSNLWSLTVSVRDVPAPGERGNVVTTDLPVSDLVERDDVRAKVEAIQKIFVDAGVSNMLYASRLYDVLKDTTFVETVMILADLVRQGVNKNLKQEGGFDWDRILSQTVAIAVVMLRAQQLKLDTEQASAFIHNVFRELQRRELLNPRGLEAMYHETRSGRDVVWADLLEHALRVNQGMIEAVHTVIQTVERTMALATPQATISEAEFGALLRQSSRQIQAQHDMAKRMKKHATAAATRASGSGSGSGEASGSGSGEANGSGSGEAAVEPAGAGAQAQEDTTDCIVN